jgi:hydrogenase/urease accessory protein HupE
VTGPRTFLLVLLIAVGSVRERRASAHELTPALLSILERGSDRYEILWRVPSDEAPRNLMAPVLPGQPVQAREVRDDSEARYERWVIRVPGGLAGGEVRLAGAAGARTDALLRIAFLDGRVVHGRLSPGGAPFVVPRHPRWWAVAGTYLRLGIEHILFGFDHLLFVLGLLVLARSKAALVRTITAFTAAHSLTLVLATLGVLHVPGPPVEATIALSIVFVAREILAPAGTSLAARRPWTVALPFGLLHGLGFAGALSGIGLPAGEVPLALAAFNVGVELGQLAFVAAILLLLRLLALRPARLPLALRLGLGYAIGAFATALCLSRIAVFAVR